MSLTPPPEFPKPRLPALTLVVGRVTTIKLAYWAAFSVFELALPAVLAASFDDRFRVSLAALLLLTVIATGWAAWAARAVDRKVGELERSIPVVATTFIVASVVASPASLPLLIIERQRSIEGCFPAVCNWSAIWLWVATLAIGSVVIPAAFALALRRSPRA